MVLLRVEGQSTSVYNIRQYNKCYITFLGDTDWQSVGAPVGADIGTTFTSNTSNVTGTGQVVIIHGSQNEIPSYYLDLGDVSMKADYSILEIQDITQRKSENTQAFTLPFTETNNDFFSHFYNVNASGDFDVNTKTNATVLVDSNEVIEGYLQLLSVNTTTQTYEVVVYGVIANIVNQLSDNKLNELDLSAYNHVLNINNVTDSWDGAITYTDASNGDEILYPIIDYGYGYDEDNIEINYNQPVLTCDRLKPAIKVYTVLKEVLKSAGYPSIDSSFLISDFFYNQYMTLGDSSEFINNDIEDNFRIGKNTGQTFNLNTPADITFPYQTSATGLDFHTGEGNLDSSGFYTAPSDGFYKFRFKINYTATSVAFYGFRINPVINSTVQEETYYGNIATTSSGFQYFTITTDLIFLNSGDVLKFQGNYTNASAGNSMLILASVAGVARQTSFELIESPASSVGSTIKFDSGNNIMPKVTQIEFLKSILSRYNLVMQRSILFPGQITIEPIQDFLDVGASIDWTDKLDTSKPVIIKPTYEFQKDKIIFKDQEAEDLATVEYEKKFGHPYNFYSIEIQSDFKQKGNNLEIDSIFSSFTNDWIGGGIDMLMPRLYQINNNEIERIDAKPKLFYYSGKKTCNNFDLYESSGSTSGTTITEYPFCSHYSMDGDTIQDTDFDIRFKSGASIGESKGGLVHKQTKTDTFTKCWSKYLHNIFDKDARILIADFKLSAVDISRLKYNDKIFVKDTYYRLNKISNYAIGKDITTRVELIKILDFENTLAIGGCGLRVGAIQYDGTVLFTESDGSASNGNKVCCEKNGYKWIGRDIQKCKQIVDSRVNTKPPTAERNRITQESRLGTDRRDTKVKGRVTELSDSENATDGQILSWNTTDGNTEWVDAPSGGGTPSTPLNSVQFNYNGAFTGDSDFSFNQFSNILDVSTIRAENATAGIYLSAGFQYMFLSPVDFIATASSSSNGFISNDGARLGIISGQTYYAQFQVPKGYKVYYINLRGSTGYTFFVYASSFSSGTQVYKATGTINTPLTLLSYQQLIGAAGDYFTIKVSPSGYGNYIYGCQIGLIKT